MNKRKNGAIKRSVVRRERHAVMRFYGEKYSFLNSHIIVTTNSVKSISKEFFPKRYHLVSQYKNWNIFFSGAKNNDIKWPTMEPTWLENLDKFNDCGREISISFEPSKLQWNLQKKSVLTIVSSQKNYKEVEQDLELDSIIRTFYSNLLNINYISES